MNIFPKIILKLFLTQIIALFVTFSLKSYEKTIDFLVKEAHKIEEIKSFDYEKVEYLQKIIKKSNPIILLEELSNLIDEYINLFQFFENFGQTNFIFTQKQIIPPPSDLCIIGDIHGSFKSLTKILNNLILEKKLNENFEILNNNFRMIFTGDYVERGLWGAEVWYTILRLKTTNPDKVFLVRGNHENMAINSIHYYSLSPSTEIQWQKNVCFEQELKLKYPNKYEKLFKKFEKLYKYLPVGVYLGQENDWVLFSHGGLDPSYDSKKFLNNKYRFELIRNDNNYSCHQLIFNYLKNLYYQCFNKNQKRQYSPESLFVWSDFFLNINNELEMKIRGSNENQAIITKEFLNQKGIKAIFRGHQHEHFGLKLFYWGYSSPQNWKNVVCNPNENSIHISNQLYIFTFSTATELGLVEKPSYGILQTSKNYDDWMLIPYELN